MSDDLVAFLRARLDEDEAGVRALTVPHHWHTGPGDDPEWTDEELVCMWPPEFHTPYEQDKHWRGITISGPELAAYVARHDPARVLAEVAAKRALMKDAFQYEAKIDGEWGCSHDAEEIEAGLCDEIDPNGIQALRLLALPYAQHPDYRPEWAPDA